MIQCLVEPAQTQQDVSQIVVRQAVRGPEAKRLLEFFDRLVPAADGCERRAKIAEFADNRRADVFGIIVSFVPTFLDDRTGPRLSRRTKESYDGDSTA